MNCSLGLRGIRLSKADLGYGVRAGHFCCTLTIDLATMREAQRQNEKAEL